MLPEISGERAADRALQAHTFQENDGGKSKIKKENGKCPVQARAGSQIRILVMRVTRRMEAVEILARRDVIKTEEGRGIRGILREIKLMNLIETELLEYTLRE